MELDAGNRIIENMSKVIVGKKDALELIVVALLSGGHVLLEDVPGVGKTVIGKCLAKSINGTFTRIQFTPDVLPGDVTGFNVYDNKTGQFNFQPGPVMTNILLADEINRAIPRTQSSLLESMEENQVTVDSKTWMLPSPFLVIATQNPIELEGTFPLPEAQLDRFLLKISLGYPNLEEENIILKRFQKDDPLPSLSSVFDPQEILIMQKMRKEVTVSDAVRRYITEITSATRGSKKIKYGASPRGSLGLMRAAQGLALLDKRNYILPDDVKKVSVPVLAHRIILKEEISLSGESADDIITGIIKKTAVPL
ncbi:MAG: MoxR family ATPase [Spirochaetia bacterium]|jgi:MoxR-like ATPase|nr:MoxR family ATPase [Spirochaetia bacterium]